ncbi:MAG: T9SS type A sorting domain-containing protein [Candidatus Neomarinimicrobiota bacterium]
MNKIFNTIWLSFYLFTFNLETSIAMEPTFQFNYDSTDIDASTDSVGSFNGTIYNISSYVIDIAVVRMINNLPEGWSSSICIGTTCFNESIDSIAIQINSGDSINCGLLAWTNGLGQGLVQLNIFDITNIDENILIDINFFFGTYNSIINQNEELDSPKYFTLIGNYPNPFNPNTTLIYDLHKDAHVNIRIYDVLGNQIMTLINEKQNMGYKSIQWNALNEYGLQAKTGLYFYKIQVDNYQQIKKMIFVK